jgi:phosphoribosyl 1,2-cyclic phosphate phosphodiesterase
MVVNEINGGEQQPSLIFLGTGGAWRTPEMGCSCVICNAMNNRGERRTRTSLWFEGVVRVLVDCGPDVADQLDSNGLDAPEAVLITHEHGDHYLGLDELEAFRRRAPREAFAPLPTYAHEAAWGTIEARFGYLLGKLLDKRLARPGLPLAGLDGRGLTITPFKTDHGPMPKGAVGYIMEYESLGRPRKLVYTSDFENVPEGPLLLREPDILVAQAHWFNEPRENIPHHMSLQRLLGFVAGWQPREHVYLVHISDGDVAQGESEADCMKKRAPLDPLRDAGTRRPLPVPTCHEEWQEFAELVFKQAGLDVPVTVARDGLKVPV